MVEIGYIVSPQCANHFVIGKSSITVILSKWEWIETGFGRYHVDEDVGFAVLEWDRLLLPG